MYISSIDQDGHLIPPAYSIGSGYTAEQAATANNLTPGAWRIITNKEALDLQKPGLAEVQKAALAALKAKRLEVEYAGPLLEVDGQKVLFPSEPKDETRMNSLAGIFMAAPDTAIADWKIADGIYVTMTAPLLQQVKAAGFAHIAATFSVERQKREAIEALASADAVTAWLQENLDTGWPD